MSGVRIHTSHLKPETWHLTPEKMLRFTLEVVNAKKLDLAFTGLMAQIRDWRSVWPHVIDRLVKIEEKQFATTGALGEHGEWKPLAVEGAPGPSGPYKTTYKKKSGKPILQDSERLRDSLTGKTSDTVDELEPLKMRFGSRVPYAIYHQKGTYQDGKPKMFARRIFDFTEVDRLVTQKTIQRLALDFSRRLGFAVAPRAGFRDVGAAEARRMGLAAALAGGPGAELSAGL